MPRMSMVEAIRDAMDCKMGEDERVVVFGEDVGYFGGVFRCTDGLQRKYGKSRCFDAPINESGIVGVAIGMGAYGLRAVAEIQFADYVYPGYDQIVSEAARLRYRSGGEFFAPIVIRMPVGGGIYGGQTHSQRPEALFTHDSGLKTVIPSNPYDAKGLLIASTIDMRGMALNSELLALLAQVARRLLIDLLEHRRRARLRPVVQRAVTFGLLGGVEDLCVDLGLHLPVALLAPGADADEVGLEPLDRIAERPGGPFVLGAIFGRIVRGRMGARAVGHPFDEGRAQIGARTLSRPERGRVDRKIIVAVDSQRRNAEAVGASGESGALAASDALIGRDRPLVVDDIEYDWRPIDGGEHQRRVEVALRCRAFADPARGDARIA